MVGEPANRIVVSIDSEDEFEGDYEDPGNLTAAAISGSVVYTVDWTVTTVVSQIDADPSDPESQGVLVTAPPFQRRTAWTEARQGLFIESLMLGLPIPPLVLAESMAHEGQFYVLDGKQRLTALQRFHSAESPLKLSGLEVLQNELTGKTLGQIQASSDLRKYARSMSSQPVRTIVVRNWRSPALLHLIFSRLNKASVPLASHELRQALFPGRFTNFINQVSAESQPLLRARRLEEPDFRLRDAETLLRHIAFRTNITRYRGDLRNFLDRVIRGGNDHFREIESDLNRLVSEMERGIEATFSIFGSEAFLRFAPERSAYLPRFNLAVFDAMTWFFSDDEIAAAAADQSIRVKDAFEQLCATDSNFSAYLTATTKTAAAAVGRIKLWGDALGRVLGKEIDYQDRILPILPIAAPER